MSDEFDHYPTRFTTLSPRPERPQECVTMELTFCLVWLRAPCVNLNGYALLTLWNKIRSILLLIILSAGISLMSIQYILLMMSCDNLSRTEMRYNLRLNPCGSQASITTTTSHATRTSTTTSNIRYKSPFSKESIIPPSVCDVSQ